ncbi:MAG: hypothetical protein WC455_18060 [Dehalococcoidia bacterium]|jgi:hypothetical protein
MELYGHIVSGKLVLPEHVKVVRAQYLASLPDGAAVCETIELAKKPKTNQQLAAFFGMVVMAAKRQFDHMGMDVMNVPLSDDQVKEVLYHYCGAVGEGGAHKRLSRMSTLEASAFFENCRTWLAGFGVVIPDPDPAWREKKK